MSYQGFEISPSAGNPAELYQFSLTPLSPFGAAAAVTPPPPAPGNLIVGDMLLAANWTLVRDLGQTSLSPVYPPSSPDSFAAWPGLARQREVWAAYHGAIGGGGAYFYERGVVTPAQGLLPSTSYVVRALLYTTQPHLSGPGFYGAAVEGGGTTQPLNIHGTYSAGPPLWADLAGTTDPAGTLAFRIGGLDLEVANADIVVLNALMVFDATGTPPGGGQPAGTGSFATFPTTTLNYTSADVPITYQGITYTPALIERQSFKSKQDGLSKAEVDVAIDLNNPIAAWFTTGHLPIAPVTCRILRVHVNDLTGNASPFVGQVVRSRIVGKQVVLSLASVERLMERRAPRVFNQRLCNNFLYDQVCRVNPATFSYTAGVVTNITENGFVVTVSGAQAFAGADLSFYKDGVLIAPDGSRTGIRGHAGDVLTLMEPIPTLAIGQVPILQAGCDLTWKTCVNRFKNAHNRRAMDLIPNRNAFTGSGLL